MERYIINDVVASIEKCKLPVALDKKTVDSLQEKIQFRFVDEGKKSIGFELKERPESKFSALVEFFNVGDDERLVFEGQFLSAISGSGSELKNITIFSSSALLSLMCFRNVAGKVLKIKGKEYRNVRFEYQNPIPGSKGSPSNVDITLFDGDTLDTSTKVLFLESKFTEPLTLGPQKDISDKVYGYIYTILEADGFFKRMDIKYEKDKEGYHKLTSDKAYCQGVKQMISHYLGALAFAAEHSSIKEVRLGTILYDNFDDEDSEKKISDYKEIYNELSKVLNKTDVQKKIKEINPKGWGKIIFPTMLEALTYKEVFTKENPSFLDASVKSFYRL